MNEKDVYKISANSEIFKHYDLLKEIGVWDQLLNLADQIKLLEELLNEALNFFNKHSVLDLVNYVTQKMLDKFIPSYLTFIIQEEFSFEKVNIISFKNLKLVDNFIKINSLMPFRNLFAELPAPITFEAFRNLIDDNKITDVFLPLTPEIIVPMMGLDGMYGFIVFGEKVIGDKYTKEEISYIDKIMKFASASLQNNIHYTRAIIESKTKLYTHSYFIKKTEEELTRVQRYNTHFSLIMIDIDFFKNVNDKYGHLIGDKILYDVAGILEKNIRQGDIAARFGGEEFVILLLEADIDKAIKIAERIRKVVEETKFNHGKDKIELTISLGITHVSKNNFLDSFELIRQADIALYQAKNSGRNNTKVYSCEFENKVL